MRRISFALCTASLSIFAGCRAPETARSLSCFPIGIYSVPATNDLKVIREAGFNLVVGRADHGYLNAAGDVGLGVLATPQTSAGPGFNPVAARRAVKDFDRHPALWGWYLSDEPDLNAVPPEQVMEAHQCVKAAGAHKPTALVLFQGYEALHYAHLADITMIDRYPVPWLPLANFGQHITLGRLAVGRNKPLIAVIQAFDWNSCPEMLPGEKNLRPPTREEIRCMTYEALARGANGLFYYAFDDGRWRLREHPETWTAVQAVVREVNDRLPLFRAQPQWWAKRHGFSDRTRRFNAALESGITSTLLRVGQGNAFVPAGDYIVAVNNTEHNQTYSFALPQDSRGQRPEGRGSRLENRGFSTRPTPDAQDSMRDSETAIPVLEENRSLVPHGDRLTDSFPPYSVHVYGPL